MEWSPALHFQAECHLQHSRQGVNSYSAKGLSFQLAPRGRKASWWLTRSRRGRARGFVRILGTKGQKHSAASVREAGRGGLRQGTEDHGHGLGHRPPWKTTWAL